MAERVRWNGELADFFTGSGTVGSASLAYVVQECLFALTRTTGEFRLSLWLTGAPAYLKDSECFSDSNMAQRARWNSGRAYFFTGTGTVGIASLAYAVKESLIASTETTGESHLILELTSESAQPKDPK
ncbi:hypothetical protein QAD02_021263 [Eretmocerus hayati]|uniref:Uncharacterized protein n=1 Tax=Eretmocerus hayati TaxID=131215 RepID=A0ACC2PUL3_9HYME|nr:hypothetical protein QAD02_021263 [Eretmocerus hayati]